MTSAQLRAAFLDFFRDRGHAVVPSSSLVPGNDPTLLFTNAGMVQFKDVFLGKEQRSYVRAASSQRCVRAGGKHNDLENVGYTSRHHTFFEMLGNFSFGDYFKHDAIRYAWDFVTGTLGIAPERLWVTVYEEDEGAAKIWLEDIGVDPERFSRMGAKSNFWAMGDTGPCGPCTEIFYDHGPGIAGGPPGSPDEDGDRYVEIWNLVFMQFDRAADGTMVPLPKPSVDTGMGLERVAAVMQGVHSNYDIDLFRNLIEAAAQAVGTSDLASNSLRVIADHVRAVSFLVADGVLPSNEGRGYVLRRIMRRAIRHGFMLGQRQPFFHKLVATLEREMGAAYPELAAQRAHIEKVVLQEEERFAETLAQGMGLLDEAIHALGGKRQIPGETVFRLYDTYGFPVDLTSDIARERGLTIDEPGFEAAMDAQRARARAASKFNVDLRGGMAVDAQTSFIGYDGEHGVGRIVALFKDRQPISELQAGEQGQVVLDVTPFYAESGGQVGDRGVLVAATAKFVVEDTQKLGKAHLHVGTLLEGTLRLGESVEAYVDGELRQATRLNHSATHLLHAALRQVLGPHVLQKGSLVAPDRLRFDFSHYSAVTPEELATIESLVNAEIRKNADAETRLMNFDAAVAAGAMALFGEKYEDEVRVLRIGDFSTELCGGTHVKRAGDIGLFKILSEGGVAAGVRRIEAVTGQGAYDHVVETDRKLRDVAGLVRATRNDVEDKVRQVIERARRLEREVVQLKEKIATGGGSRDLAAEAKPIGSGGVKLVAASVEGADAAALRNTVDQLKSKLGSGIIVLGSAAGDDKVTLIAGVTSDLTDRVKAGEIVNFVAKQVGGKGGGRADLAQAGGTQPANLEAALNSLVDWLSTQLT
ncbi:MAG TPA: alanine--tRNA ligase [Steroidobacteraceae bacterium]|nr:alanine--tRNA ligase [Steroidobacteraceae bacterium]